MAVAQLIAPGNTASTSPDITVPSGSNVCFVMVEFDSSAEVFLDVKYGDGLYQAINVLSVASGVFTWLAAPGVFRLRRPAGSKCGVYQTN